MQTVTFSRQVLRDVSGRYVVCDTSTDEQPCFTYSPIQGIWFRIYQTTPYSSSMQLEVATTWARELGMLGTALECEDGRTYTFEEWLQELGVNAQELNTEGLRAAWSAGEDPVGYAVALQRAS